MTLGRFFTEPEVLHRRRVVVLGDTAYQALFAKSGLDPIGKKVRIGAIEYTVIGRAGEARRRSAASATTRTTSW